jgi:hypothetical protein
MIGEQDVELPGLSWRHGQRPMARYREKGAAALDGGKCGRAFGDRVERTESTMVCYDVSGSSTMPAGSRSHDVGENKACSCMVWRRFGTDAH